MQLARARARLRLRALDASDRVRGRRARLVPPRRVVPVGRPEELAAADALAARLPELAGLTASSSVLELDCGSGALARALTAQLGPEGSYVGCDADHDAIGWCRRSYRAHPRFAFRVDTGAGRLAHPDATFDLVVAPFAHLLPGACEQRLADAARVLRPGGVLVARVFALTPASRAAIADGTAGLLFEGDEEVALLDDALPEEAVAYAEDWLSERLRERGLTPTSRHPGTWCGQEQGMGFHDVWTAVRGG